MAMLRDSGFDLEKILDLWGPLLDPLANGNAPGGAILFDLASLQAAEGKIREKEGKILENLDSLLGESGGSDEPGQDLREDSGGEIGGKVEEKGGKNNNLEGSEVGFKEVSGVEKKSTAVGENEEKMRSRKVNLVFGLSDKTKSALVNSGLTGTEGWEEFRKKWFILREKLLEDEGNFPGVEKLVVGLKHLSGGNKVTGGTLSLADWMEVPPSVAVDSFWIQEILAW